MPTISLTKRTWNILDVPAPIRNEHASFDIAMKAAMGPIGYMGDVPVFHWIEMNVINMSFEIRFIANSVLPIAALPDALLSLGKLALRSWPSVESA